MNILGLYIAMNIFLRASLVAQMVKKKKKLPAMLETCFRSLGREDSPGE